jgi:murein DD-endopeptidase MepM/ murein hydrolase activator NlpD
MCTRTPPSPSRQPPRYAADCIRSAQLHARRRGIAVVVPGVAAAFAMIGMAALIADHGVQRTVSTDRTAADDAFELTPAGVLVRVTDAGSGAAMPVFGVTHSQLANTFGEPRPDERRHIGIDIPAPRGTPVVAALDGWVVSLPHGGAGGRGLYLLDRTGTWLLYYAHLDAYADGVWPGMAVRRRELIGYVGSTGNAAMPHLHFEVGRIRRPGTLQVEPVNPYLFLTRSAATRTASGD